MSLDTDEIDRRFVEKAKHGGARELYEVVQGIFAMNDEETAQTEEEAAEQDKFRNIKQLVKDHAGGAFWIGAEKRKRRDELNETREKQLIGIIEKKSVVA